MYLERERPQETFAQSGDLQIPKRWGVRPKMAEKVDWALTLMTLQATGNRQLKIRVWTIYRITGSRHCMQVWTEPRNLGSEGQPSELY